MENSSPDTIYKYANNLLKKEIEEEHAFQNYSLALLFFTGILLFFCMNLAEVTQTLKILKIVATVFFSIGSFFSILTFYPYKKDILIFPNELSISYNNWQKTCETTQKDLIVKISKIVGQLTSIQKRKLITLHLALHSITFGIVALSLNIILSCLRT